MTKNIKNASYIRVSPGIGMARVGNSDEYFIGPETPEVVPVPDNGKYKDNSGALKPQAQRFRVFAYDGSDKLIAEITNGDTVNGTVATLNWSVHVTNMKAANYAFQGKYGFNNKQLRNSTIQNGIIPALRDRLIIDPGVKNISGINSGPVELIDNVGSGSVIFDVADMKPEGGFTLPAAVQFDPPQISTDPTKEIAVTYHSAKVSLGNLYTDKNGRLVFVGGKGKAESCTTPSVIISKIPTTENDLKDNPEYNGNSYFNNPGWYDDTCGGSINVEIIDNSGNTILDSNDNAKKRGWIGVSPPNYSPSTNNVVSLLDLQLDIYPEIDPYTGQGPITVAVNAKDKSIYLGQSNDGVVFDYFQIGGNLKSSHRPAIAVLNGVTYVTILGTNNVLYIANSADSYRFFAINTYVKTLLAPAMTVFNNQIQIAITATDGLPYVAASATATSSDFNFKAVDSPELGLLTSALSPAIIAYEGQLFVAYITKGQNILLAVLNSQTSTFNTHHIGTAENAISGPSLSFFKGKLAITYNDKNILLLATSFVNFDSDQKVDFNFNLVAIIPSGTGIEGFSPAISYFNNKLYLTNINGKGDILIGVSSDARSFTFDNNNAGISTFGGTALCTYEDVNFFRDIYPILHTVTDYAWTNERAFHGHRPGSQGDFLREDYLKLLANPALGNKYNNSAARVFVYDFIRPPAEQLDAPFPAPPISAPSGVSSNEDQRIDLMPRLFGNGGSPDENLINGTKFPNQWLSLTNNQLAKFQRWVNGDFVPGTKGQKRWQDIPKPDQLDFAALQPTVGGGFHPGIELTYLMHEPVFFNSPFRFAQKTIPGSIAGYMSVPWQGDFWSCNISWWPAIRPDVVIKRNDESSPPVLNAIPWFRGAEIPPYADGIDNYNDGYQTMADNWPKFGIVVPIAGKMDQGEQVFEETERDESLNAPTILNCVLADNNENGLVLTEDGNKVIAKPDDNDASQQWKLVPFSGSPEYFTIQSNVDHMVLSVESGSNQLILTTLSIPHSDAQLWQYLPSGYPGTCYLIAKINGKLLTNTSGVVNVKGHDKNQSSGNTQKWRLSNSSS